MGGGAMSLGESEDMRFRMSVGIEPWPPEG